MPDPPVPPGASGPVDPRPTGAPLPLIAGKFQVLQLEPLGAGGMGRVALARDVVLDRPVALKCLHEARFATAADAERFRTEAVLLARVSHPNVLTIYESGRDGHELYLALEYMHGRCWRFELEHRARAAGRPVGLPWREATGAIREAALGLAALHLADIVHRDVKPANMLRGPRTGGGWYTKVADFGIARFGPPTGRTTSVGTYEYMSPEQWRNTGAGPPADVYGLAATFFALLTGRPPFVHEFWGDLGRAHCEDAFPDPWSVGAEAEENPDVAVRIQSILGTASAKNPADRYPTAAEFAAAIEPLLVGAPAGPVGGAGQLDPPVRSGAPLEHTNIPGGVEFGAAPRHPHPPPAEPPRIRVVLRSPSAPGAPEPERPPSRPRLEAELPQVPRASGTELPLMASNAVASAEQRRWAGWLGAEWANGFGMTFRLVPPGRADLGARPGDPDGRAEPPLARRSFPAPFWVATFPVTRAVLGAFLSGAAGRFPETVAAIRRRNDPQWLAHSRLPVTNLRFREAEQVCEWLSEDGFAYRLPTEDEWEYFARAGSCGRYWWEEAVPGTFGRADAPFALPTGAPVAIGHGRENAWGLDAVLGNVSEWCRPEVPPGPHPVRGEPDPVTRGGDFSFTALAELRLPRRRRWAADRWDERVGFRVVRELSSDERNRVDANIGG